MNQILLTDQCQDNHFFPTVFLTVKSQHTCSHGYSIHIYGKCIPSVHVSFPPFTLSYFGDGKMVITSCFLSIHVRLVFIMIMPYLSIHHYPFHPGTVVKGMTIEGYQISAFAYLDGTQFITHLQGLSRMQCYSFQSSLFI